MTTFAEPGGDLEGPGFDRQRLAPDRIPRVLELTSNLCAMNADLSLQATPAWVGRRPSREIPPEVAARRRALLDELHRLIAG
jgi:hypothetical protein